MKLNTQENIRATLLGTYLLSGVVSTALLKSSDIIQLKEIENLLLSSSIFLGDISNITRHLYFLDFYTIGRTQRFTEEYRTIKELYGYTIVDFCCLCKNFGIKDSPVKIFALFVYMYRSGYLSHNMDFKYSTDMKDFASLEGVDVIRGRGVCRSLASMLTDVYNDLGYSSYNLSVNASGASIDKLQKLSKVALQTEEKGTRFAKIVGKITSIVKIPNHLITMVCDGDKTYIFDPTNDGMLHKERVNRIVTYDDDTAYMTNHFWSNFFLEIMGQVDDSIPLSKQMSFFWLNKDKNQFIDDSTYRREYLEMMQLCIDKEEYLQWFYEINKKRYENIYNISLEQRDYIRRLMPIIPKKKEKTK